MSLYSALTEEFDLRAYLRKEEFLRYRPEPRLIGGVWVKPRVRVPMGKEVTVS